MGGAEDGAVPVAHEQVLGVLQSIAAGLRAEALFSLLEFLEEAKVAGNFGHGCCKTASETRSVVGAGALRGMERRRGWRRGEVGGRHRRPNKSRRGGNGEVRARVRDVGGTVNESGFGVFMVFSQSVGRLETDGGADGHAGKVRQAKQ